MQEGGGLRAVFDEFRKAVIGKDAVVGDADDDAEARECLTDEAVFA